MLAALNTGLQQVLLGLGILALAFVLRRTARRQQNKRDNPLREVADVLRQREEAQLHAARRAEIRLHEVAREYEAKLATHAAFLEQLIRDADDRIARLEGLIGHPSSAQSNGELRVVPEFLKATAECSTQSHPASTTPADTTAADQPQRSAEIDRAIAARSFVVNMSLAGFSDKEIAHCAGLPLEQVRSFLHQSPQREDTGPEQTSRAA